MAAQEEDIDLVDLLWWAARCGVDDDDIALVVRTEHVRADARCSAPCAANRRATKFVVELSRLAGGPSRPPDADIPRRVRGCEPFVITTREDLKVAGETRGLLTCAWHPWQRLSSCQTDHGQFTLG